MTTTQARAAFPAVRGHLDAATCGVPPVAAAQAMTAAVQEWAAGRADLAGYDVAVAAARAAFARLVGVPTSWVAIGAQVSALVALVAASLPPGASVLVAAEDFTSVTYPFLTQADRGVRVRAVPLAALADAVEPGDDVVAFSLVQSADGRVADSAAVAAAAAAVGARTVVDLTQAAGWLPVDATRFDVTVTGAYKWLAAPRGVAFATVSPAALGSVRPAAAGWYAGEDPWSSCYGTTMQLAGCARRLDVSPAWLAWAGAVPALELFAAADLETVRAYDVGLADALRTGLGLPPGGSAIVALPDPDGRRRAALADAGLRVAGRAGAVRLAFHLWADESDVARALAAIRA